MELPTRWGSAWLPGRIRDDESTCMPLVPRSQLTARRASGPRAATNSSFRMRPSCGQALAYGSRSQPCGPWTSQRSAQAVSSP